jgi:hypothetical protein
MLHQPVYFLLMTPALGDTIAASLFGGAAFNRVGFGPDGLRLAATDVRSALGTVGPMAPLIDMVVEECLLLIPVLTPKPTLLLLTVCAAVISPE